LPLCPAGPGVLWGTRGRGPDCGHGGDWAVRAGAQAAGARGV